MFSIAKASQLLFICLVGKTSDLTFGLFPDMLLSTAISCVFPWYQTNSVNTRLYTDNGDHYFNQTLICFCFLWERENFPMPFK